jgi:hypothetical protein
MSKFLFILVFSILAENAFAQVTEIIITSIERTDRTFHDKGELFLENRATKNQIIYTIDTLTKNLSTQKYLMETYYSVWDGDTTIKEQIKTKHKRWKHKISRSEWENILSSLMTDVDTLQKDMRMQHTSHHYLNIYIDVINNNDTMRYSKTKPFSYLTPWWTQKPSGSVLNPSINIQMVAHLPKKFIGRKELILMSTRGLSPED